MSAAAASVSWCKRMMLSVESSVGDYKHEFHIGYSHTLATNTEFAALSVKRLIRLATGLCIRRR